MSKNKHKKQKRHSSIMGRSDIPFAQRLKIQKNQDIAVNREHAAKIAMMCMSCAMHEVEGIGYKRLTRFSLAFHENVEEFYEDVEVGLAHAKRRMEQIGMPISGELYAVNIVDKDDVQNHAAHAIQVALIVGTITANGHFGFGKERLERILVKTREHTARYAKEGEGFLLEKVQKLGFPIIDGRITAFMDDDGNPVIASRAIKEGYLDASVSSLRRKPKSLHSI